MKNKLLQLISIISVLSILLFTFPVTAFSASDFIIEDGVLLSYQGSSSSVTIPSDVYAIGDSAFENNKKITSVNLTGVSVIGNKAFANCVALKTVTGTTDITSCGAYAFFNTPFQISYSSKTLILGNVLVYSGESGDVIIDDKVVSVAPYAFSGNSKITSVFTGVNVVSVGEGAFYNCSALKEVNLSKYVTYIGAFAFEGTPYLTSSTDAFLVMGDGILVDVNSKSDDLSVPATVKQIGAGAFYNNTTVKKVTLPDSVTAINMRAFAGCAALSGITLPQKLIMIDKEAFSGCSSLKTITIPASVTLVGESVFVNCTGLQSVHMLSSAPVSRGMFASCSALKYVRLTEGVTTIRDYAFYNCKNLSEISVPPSAESISHTAFTGADKASVWCRNGSYAENFCKAEGISTFHVGDTNLDGSVNIKDATLIQKVTAKLVVLEFNACLRGDFDFNGEINVRDATAIQKYTAGIVQ